MDLSSVFGRMPSVEWSSIRFGWPNLMQMAYKNELTQALVKIETPFDFYIDMVKLLSKIPGMSLLKIDKKKGLVITWEEINEVWVEAFRSMRGLPAWSVNKLRTQ